ncbi:rRNA maturation RNase YbeY [bacterium]|nr:rRNA maturation RNase YbeY [bacterium]
MVEINNLTTVSIDQDFVKNIVETVLKGENKEKKRISLAFVGPRRIKEINRRYRKKNRVTDVLSFPESEVEMKEFGVGELQENKNILGEIVVCLKEVKKNSRRYQISFETELARVIIHGVLHLLGYDHEKSEEEKEKMQKKEEYYLSLLKLN